MRTRILLPVFFLFSYVASAQHTFSYELTVRNKKAMPDVGREVVFIEANTYEHVAYKTDASGKLSVTFDHGERWLGSVGEMRNCIDLETGRGGKATRTMTYDPEGWAREHEIKPDRRSIAFTTVNQERLSPVEEPDQTHSVLHIRLEDRNHRGYSKVSVKLVCFETATIYENTTTANGGATFKLPVNQKYEIDVDGVESLKWIDLDARAMTMNMKILYQPRTFTEKQDKRFVVQTVPADVEPSSSHARVKMTIVKEGDRAINEDVYVRMLKSNKVYKGKTNDQGEVTFMLPLRSKYLVDFQYQRDAHEVDLSDVQGIAFQDFTVQYTIDPRLADIENFIPKVKELIDYDIQNFVDKQYPEPTTGDVDFYLSWGNKFNANSKEALLEIGLKVKSRMTRKSKEPLNICFVVDKSGSMMGEDRLEQVKKSMIKFIQQLAPTDMVSIVVFDDQPVVAVPAQKVGDKKKIIDIVYAIQSGGGTNILDGMVMGFEEVKKLRATTTLNRLLLLTDGYGSNPPEMVIEKAKSYIKGGIELSAIGVGADYNQALLSQLASAGGGMLHLAGTSQNIDEIFQRELESILYPFAKKATLTVRYNDQIVYRQLYGYSNEVVVPGKMNVTIPNLFPGLDQLALVKFDILNATPEIEKEKVEVTLEYTDAVSGKPVKLVKELHPEWTTATGALDMAIDKQHKKILAVAVANQQLKVMANAFESGNRDAALAAAQSGIAQMKSLFPDASPEDLISILGRLQEYVDAFELLKAQSNY
jgi:Ca-activated chloride channel family protein